MGYGTNGLTFNTLRGGNVARLPQFKDALGRPAHSKEDGSDWSIAEWLEAVTGELGEFANMHKKVRRGDFGVTAVEVYSARDMRRYLNADWSEPEQVKVALGSELADVVIYLDILAFRLGIDLGAAVMAKFNETSSRVGATVNIAADGWHTRAKDTKTND